MIEFLLGMGAGAAAGEYLDVHAGEPGVIGTLGIHYKTWWPAGFAGPALLGMGQFGQFGSGMLIGLAAQKGAEILQGKMAPAPPPAAPAVPPA